MQRMRFSILAGLLCFFAVVACSENPNNVKTLGDGRPTIVVTPTETLDQSIDKLLSLFPKDLGARDEQRIQQGQNEDLNPQATWNSIKRKYAAGASNPAQLTAAKKELFRLSDWVTRNAQEMNTPPDGESKTAAAARLVLYISMYVYGGPNTVPPPFTPGADAVVGVVTPNAPATIVTPTLHAGVQFEAGSVAENTIVVVTQNPTRYPDNCSGPLQTRLCQYPQFYTFDMFPHKRLLKGAKFSVCHINSGESRYPLADHDRFRFAHAKPADPADYTPGSTIRDQNGESIEILPLVAQTFSNCSNNVYANNSVGRGALGVLSQLARGIQSFVSPSTAYAVDLGLGGLSFDTSPFNVVDPLGLPDLAVQSFSVAPTSALAGGHVTLSYAVKNIGTATGASVPATVFLTPPAGEGPPPVAQQIGSITIPSLVPGATDTRTDVVVTIPQPLPPGTYHISLVVGSDPAFPDSDPANNSASAVLTIIRRGATDLGTLGGTFSGALAINALGQVVGNSYTAGDATQHAFLWQSGTGMTDLGTLGGTSSQVATNDGFGARAINASGQVVGWSNVAGDAAQHAFLWQNGTGMTDLGTLGGTFSYAAAVNAVGQVVGYSATVGSGVGTRHAFLWQNGTGMTDLGTLGGTASDAIDVNDLGQVVGSSFTTGNAQQHAFLWQRATGMTDLGTLGGTLSRALAVNALGQVAGYSATAGGVTHAFLWQSGTGMTDLGALSGGFSAAVAVNALGQVVGWSFPAGNAALHAFLWQSGTGIADLGTLGGTYSVAVAVNALGQVVGNSTTAGGVIHAFLRQSGTGMTDLGTLGGSFSSALAVNDQGQIVGQSQTAGGQTHATLWNRQ